MERDLIVMIYGAIMGVVGSIITSIVTALFHFWLERREYERRQIEERQRQLKQIHLPTDDEVRTIYLEHQEEQHAEPARTLAGAGSLSASVLLSSLTVYQTHDPRLAFLFGACLCYLLTNRVIRTFKR